MDQVSLDQPSLSLEAEPSAVLPTSDRHWGSFAASPFPVAIIFVVGLGLRLLLLGSKSIWLDEALSIRFATHAQDLWAGGYDHSHPPLYYMLLQYWLPLGNSEFVLRLSSALVGSIAVPLGYALAMSLGGRAIALSTAWLIALSPLLVWYSQELRSYSLLVVLALLMALALVRLVARPHLLWWLLFVAAMSAALYTHYVAAALILVQVGLIAVLNLQARVTRQGVIAWLGAWPVIVLLYWPWLTTPGMNRFIEQMGEGDPYPIEMITHYLPISPTVAAMLINVAALLAIPIALVIGIWMLRQGRATWNRWAASPITRYALLLLFLALVILSVVPRAYTAKKLLVQFLPFGLLIMGWVFPWRRANRIPLALLLVASLVGSFANIMVVPKDQWREFSAYLTTRGEPSDAVWVLPAYHTLPLDYYLARASEASIPSDVGTDFEMQPVSGGMSDSDLDALLDDGQRVWLVYHTANARLVDPNRRLERWLAEHMQPVDRIDLYKIEATLYAPRP